VTLSHVARLGQRIWIRCNGCGHEQIVEPLAFAAFHGLDEGTPLLSISERLVCTACAVNTRRTVGQSRTTFPMAALEPNPKLRDSMASCRDL
jgi:hypothetical protein